jgi:hypothetical protein
MEVDGGLPRRGTGAELSCRKMRSVATPESNRELPARDNGTAIALSDFRIRARIETGILAQQKCEVKGPIS